MLVFAVKLRNGEHLVAGGLRRARGINDNNRKVGLLPSLSHQTCSTSGEIVIQIRLVRLRCGALRCIWWTGVVEIVIDGPGEEKRRFLRKGKKKKTKPQLYGRCLLVAAPVETETQA